MMAGAVAGVQKRNVDELARHLGCSLVGVAQHQRVRVPFDDANRVCECLPFLTLEVYGPHIDDVAAQAFHRGVEAHLGAGARLEKEESEHGVFVPVGERRRVGVDLCRAVEHGLDVRQESCLLVMMWSRSITLCLRSGDLNLPFYHEQLTDRTFQRHPSTASADPAVVSSSHGAFFRNIQTGALFVGVQTRVEFPTIP